MLDDYLIISFIFILALLSPGPDLALVTQNSLIYDRKKAIFTSLGIGAGILIHISYSILGFAIVIANSIVLFNIIKYLGAAYLIYLGIMALKEKKEQTIIDHSVKSKKTISNKRAFWQGFLCNALNPKATLVFLSIFSVFMKPDTPLWFQILIGTQCILFCMTWFTLVSYFLSLPVIQKASQKFLFYITKVTGCVFILFGLQLAISDK